MISLEIESNLFRVTIWIILILVIYISNEQVIEIVYPPLLYLLTYIVVPMVTNTLGPLPRHHRVADPGRW